MNNLRGKVVIVVLTIVLFCTGFLSGCMTARGFFSDVGDCSRAAERYLDPIEDGRRPSR